MGGPGVWPWFETRRCATLLTMRVEHGAVPAKREHHLVRRGDELLLMVVRSDDGAIKGYRPLGGSIEFGERAADALKREFTEELGLAIA